jgi:UDP-N-acetylglucosamine--N-acetylmuramyl-(pentapeptide) pyrophosphoryl-undecaprenol N-acetylglucosamine transferase
MAKALEELGDLPWLKLLGYCEEMPVALRAATLAVSRAGAMTTSELMAWGVPPILVPLPTSAEGHQRHNAQSLAEAGAALHIPESKLTGTTLWEAVVELLSDSQRLGAMRAAALDRGFPEATSAIAEALAAMLPARREVVS